MAASLARLVARRLAGPGARETVPKICNHQVYTPVNGSAENDLPVHR
jgi:hypothetical protein